MHEKDNVLGKHTDEEGVLVISFNFLANPKSHSCNTYDTQEVTNIYNRLRELLTE